VEHPVVVDGVGKTFGKLTVLSDICLQVPASQLLGLVGPSGAGKTTLVRIMAGIAAATTGRVVVLGERMPSLRASPRLGFMAQADALYGDLTAWDNLVFFASLYGLTGQTKLRRVQELLELLELAPDAKRKAGVFSGGMKRRLSLAIALVHHPEVLILDEPTTGLDPVLRQSVWDELRKLQKQGATVIVTTHSMEEAAKCERLAMIRLGRLIAVGAPQQLLDQAAAPTLEDAFIILGRRAS
jgi:ABC-2 type transport system ATP-binding protein